MWLQDVSFAFLFMAGEGLTLALRDSVPPLPSLTQVQPAPPVCMLQEAAVRAYGGLGGRENCHSPYSFLFLILFFFIGYSFLSERERQTDRDHKWERGRKGGRHRIRSRLQAVSTELHQG